MAKFKSSYTQIMSCEPLDASVKYIFFRIAPYIPERTGSNSPFLLREEKDPVN